MSRAIQYRRFGAPEMLQLIDVPVEEPRVGQVRINVWAAGLNPVDAKTFTGMFPVRPAELVSRLRHPSRWFSRTFPRTVGRDFAGVVDAVGSDITGVAVGDTVLGTLRSAPGDAAVRGSLTDHLIAPVNDVVHLPDGLDFRMAASLGVAAQTACGALRHLDVGPSDVLAISGAAGSVGSIATQLAALRGATVLGIAGSSSAEQLCRWGAVPVDYDGDVTDQLRTLAPGPITAFLDCYGGDYVSLALGLGVQARRVGTLVPSPAVLFKRVQFTGSRHAQAGDLDQVAADVANSTIEVSAMRVVPFTLDTVQAAYADLLAGRVREKLVVDLTGTPQE